MHRWGHMMLGRVLNRRGSMVLGLVRLVMMMGMLLGLRRIRERFRENTGYLPGRVGYAALSPP